LRANLLAYVPRLAYSDGRSHPQPHMPGRRPAVVAARSDPCRAWPDGVREYRPSRL